MLCLLLRGRTKTPDFVKVNWNTLIITAGFTVIGYFGKGAYEDIRSTHDAVIMMRQQVDAMTPKALFDLQLSEVRARISLIEIEIQKMKAAPTR